MVGLVLISALTTALAYAPVFMMMHHFFPNMTMASQSMIAIPVLVYLGFLSQISPLISFGISRRSKFKWPFPAVYILMAAITLILGISGIIYVPIKLIHSLIRLRKNGSK